MGKDWSKITAEFFRTATDDGLREWVAAKDSGLIEPNEHNTALEKAFQAEVNRRSDAYYDSFEKRD